MLTAGAEGTLAALPRLRELNLSFSDLRSVPASMASLTRLTRLVLRSSEVADGWQHLPLQLEVLDMSSLRRNLAAVPLELSRLARLTELDLSGNLSDGNAGLGAALPPALQRLGLSDNYLTAVPAALAPLTRLSFLALGKNQLAGGWRHLGGMQQLAHLEANGCSLAAMPRMFSQLVALTSLDLQGNPIVSGWKYLASMQELAHLSLRSCGLVAVPSVFSQLTALTCLELNPIVSGWQHLSMLALRYLLSNDRAHSFLTDAQGLRRRW